MNLTMSDFYASVSYYLNLNEGIGKDDEIDHLGNRRVKQVGELLQNQFKIGFSRMERVIRERMTTQDIETVTLKHLLILDQLLRLLKNSLVVVSYHNLWIKLIQLLNLLIREDYQH